MTRSGEGGGLVAGMTAPDATTAVERVRADPMPFVCLHGDPRCEDDPCPWGIARFLCNAPADHPIRTALQQQEARDGRE